MIDWTPPDSWFIARVGAGQVDLSFCINEAEKDRLVAFVREPPLGFVIVTDIYGTRQWFRPKDIVGIYEVTMEQYQKQTIFDTQLERLKREWKRELDPEASWKDPD